MEDPRREIERKNKKLVEEAVQEIFGNQNISAIEKYFSCEYIEHNPYFRNGSKGIQEQITKYFPKEWMGMKIDIKRISAEGNLVWTHSKFPNPEESGQFFSAMDCYRIEDGKIVEHWDAFVRMTEETTTKNKVNPNPYF